LAVLLLLFGLEERVFEMAFSDGVLCCCRDFRGPTSGWKGADIVIRLRFLDWFCMLVHHGF